MTPGWKRARDAALHPGEMLREEFMKPLGLSSNALAMELRVPVTRISEIVRERRGITADTALRLGPLLQHVAGVLDAPANGLRSGVGRRCRGAAIARRFDRGPLNTAHRTKNRGRCLSAAASMNSLYNGAACIEPSNCKERNAADWANRRSSQNNTMPTTRTRTITARLA